MECPGDLVGRLSTDPLKQQAKCEHLLVTHTLDKRVQKVVHRYAFQNWLFYNIECIQ